MFCVGIEIELGEKVMDKFASVFSGFSGSIVDPDFFAVFCWYLNLSKICQHTVVKIIPL